MLARRFLAPAAAAAMTSRRFKSAKEVEDDRWLEAVLDEHTKEMTNEERYAAQKQKEIMKKILGKARDDAHAKVAAVEDKHAEEIASLKKRLSDLEKKK